MDEEGGRERRWTKREGGSEGGRGGREGVKVDNTEGGRGERATIMTLAVTVNLTLLTVQEFLSANVCLYTYKYFVHWKLSHSHLHIYHPLFVKYSNGTSAHFYVYQYPSSLPVLFYNPHNYVPFKYLFTCTFTWAYIHVHEHIYIHVYMYQNLTGHVTVPHHCVEYSGIHAHSSAV